MEKGQMSIIGGLLVAIVAVVAVLFAAKNVKVPLTPERLSEKLPAITLEEKLQETERAVESFTTTPPEISEGSKIRSFGCSSAGVPACNGEVDVKNWEEYVDVMRNEIFPLIRDRGLDPCKIILGIAPLDYNLYSSYDPSIDPRVVDCK